MTNNKTKDIFNKFGKFFIILTCIPLLSSCTNMFILGVSPYDGRSMPEIKQEIVWPKGYAGYHNTLNSTYNKDFSMQIVKLISNNASNVSNNSSVDNNSNNSNLDFASYTSNYSVKCQQVNFSLKRESTFNINFTEQTPQNPIKTVPLDKLSVMDNNNIPITSYLLKPTSSTNSSNLSNSTNSSKEQNNQSAQYFVIYLLKDALNYQLCSGLENLNNNITNIATNKNLSYNINLLILSNFRDCDKWGHKEQCLALHYTYNINVVNNKTNKKFAKNLEYTDNTSYSVADIAYNPLNYYILPIVRKNRDVIDKEVFTYELYHSLGNTLQNSTTH